MQDNDSPLVIRDATQLHHPSTRRGFLRALGLGGTVVLLPSVFAACRESTAPRADADVEAAVPPAAVVLNLSTDVGILNYAYALEQLEAAFYSTVLTSAAGLFTVAAETEVLTDLRNHEVIHRDFLAQTLGTARIPALAANFTPVLGSRDSILRAARQFEDLGVAAYNGAAQYLDSAANLLVAGKIVSVEARHAAAIRDILDATGTAFADNTFETIIPSAANAIERALAPADVLAAVSATGVVRTPIRIGTPAA